MVILVNGDISNKMGNPILKICRSEVHLYLTEQSHKKLTYIFSNIGVLEPGVFMLIVCFCAQNMVWLG